MFRGREAIAGYVRARVYIIASRRLVGGRSTIEYLFFDLGSVFFLDSYNLFRKVIIASLFLYQLYTKLR